MSLQKLREWAQSQIDNTAKPEVRPDIGISVLQIIDDVENMSDLNKKVNERDRNRNQILKLIYQITDSKLDKTVDLNKFKAYIEQKLELDEEEIKSILGYLNREKLIDLSSYYLVITHEGVKEIEKSIKFPDQPTRHFPLGSVVIKSLHTGSGDIVENDKIEGDKVNRNKIINP